MPEESFKHKLTTMFSADVAGYSRPMAEDEASTVKTLEAYRGIMTELIKQHRGRVLDSPGDNVLAEFRSVVDGVQCAGAVQKELHARNATFTYKGMPVEVQQVAEELGVRQVLEGGVRRDAGRVRITAQLVDAIKGVHFWAERYDRDLKDIFAIQDDMTKQIIAALHLKLTIGEEARVIARETNSLEA